MDLNSEFSQKSEHFIDVAMANIQSSRSTECLHTGSVTGFDGYIVTSSSLPCVADSTEWIFQLLPPEYLVNVQSARLRVH